MDALNFLEGMTLNEEEMLMVRGGISSGMSSGGHCGKGCDGSDGNYCGDSCKPVISWKPTPGPVGDVPVSTD